MLFFLHLKKSSNFFSLLPEERWTSIKLRAVKEMYKWITTYPHTFIIKRRCLGYLTKLILDKVC